MQLQTQLTQKTDYPELVSWWETWNKLKVWKAPPPSIDMLPNHVKDGVMVSYEGQNLCAGFIYRTPSAFCWVEYIVSNPNVKDRQLRKDSKEVLINTLSQLAKNMGFKIIFTSLNNPHLIKNYSDCGFVKGSQTFEMVKRL